MTWTPRHTINVSEVLDLFPRLGVPHFQRGRVWGADAIAALLESLFYGTPCGSFVLWEAADNAAYGIPLDESNAGQLDYLIVDGQQRVRSLYHAFTDLPIDTDYGSDESAAAGDEKGAKQWCLNLTKAPIFETLLKPRARNFPLFVYAANPKVASARSPLRDNILPLKDILQEPTWEALTAYHGRLAFIDGSSKEDGLKLAAEAYPELRRKVLEIKTREFFVTKCDKATGLAQMADLYNRINASGKQVETEERAFAALVGMQARNTAVSDGLREVFQKVHPERARRLTSHDALLKREEERAFGFKLFIRVFLQVCQHHLAYRQARSNFSFDLVGEEDFRGGFKKLPEESVKWLWHETSRILAHVKNSLLAEELKCDDLRTLPDATGLMPVIQLLIQYPQLEDASYRPLLAGLCLRLALGDIGSRELLKWVAEAGDPAKKAFDVIPGLWKVAASTAVASLSSKLESANSIQDRYVLLLYWLERYLVARDFSYDAVINKKKDLKPPELLLDKQAKPEKQHLVPFAYSPKIFGKEVRRTESHPFNNIGNLTYISEQLNGLSALSDDFADLQSEREHAESNLMAHLLHAPGHEDCLNHYIWLKGQLQSAEGKTDSSTRLSPSPETLEPKFLALTKTRRRLIQLAFEKWLVDLDTRTSKNLKIGGVDEMTKNAGGLPRIAPRQPRFPIDTHPIHFLAGLGLPDEAADRLTVALGEARRKVIESSTLLLQMTRRKHVWLEVSTAGATFHVSSRLVGPLRAGVFRAVGLPDSSQSGLRLQPVPDLRNLAEYCVVKDAEIASTIREARQLGTANQQGPPPALDQLGYSGPVLQCLVALGGDDKGKPKADAALSLRFFQTSLGGASHQVLRIDLYQGGKQFGLRLRPDLGAKLKVRYPGLSFRITKHKCFCIVADEQTMVLVLDWLSLEFKSKP